MRSVPLLRYRCGISFSSRPTPSRSLLSLCLLELSPAPGRGMCGRLSDLRLRAWLRSACLLPYRSALSLTLIRYCDAVIFFVCLFLSCWRMVRCGVLRPACLVGRRPAPFPVPPSRHPARRTGMGWRGVAACLLACLSHRDCCGVLVRACGFSFSVGFAAVMCAAS